MQHRIGTRLHNSHSNYHASSEPVLHQEFVSKALSSAPRQACKLAKIVPSQSPMDHAQNRPISSGRRQPPRASRTASSSTDLVRPGPFMSQFGVQVETALYNPTFSHQIHKKKKCNMCPPCRPITTFRRGVWCSSCQERHCWRCHSCCTEDEAEDAEVSMDDFSSEDGGGPVSISAINEWAPANIGNMATLVSPPVLSRLQRHGWPVFEGHKPSFFTRRCDEGHYLSFYKPAWGTWCPTCGEWMGEMRKGMKIGICRNVKHRQYRCFQCCQEQYWRNILDGHRHGDIIPHREPASTPERYPDEWIEDWRIRIGGSMPDDVDFWSDSSPATLPLSYKYEEAEEEEKWIVTYYPPSSSARVEARWQWFVLLIVTSNSRRPAWDPSFSIDYASRFIHAFHNPLRP